MSFDINTVVADMIAAVKNTVKDNWKHVKETATSYLNSKKDRLELLASLKLQGEISETFFQKRLLDEKKILESELLSLQILSKAIAQKTANAALDVLNKAIEAALGLV